MWLKKSLLTKQQDQSTTVSTPVASGRTQSHSARQQGAGHASVTVQQHGSAQQNRTVQQRKKLSNLPITAVSAIIIVLFAGIQFLSVFNTYALNLAQLNALRNQEAALIEQQAEIQRNIERWNDKEYVTAQARERLGFVFPGEKSVRVLGAERAQDEGTATSQQQDETKVQSSTPQPWYHMMMLSLHSADDSGKVE